MSQKARRILCLAAIALCLPGIWLSARRLPLETRDLIERKYAGWNGVLRIWAYEGWTGGDALAGWLNRCAAGFEKGRNGVYVEVKYVPREALTAWRTFGAQPPDMILFPPNVLSSSEALALLEAPNLRMPLCACGENHAVPVALGGYAWAINPEAEGIAAPPDEEERSWSQAVAALADPGAIMEETEFELPGLDLGLPAMATSDVEIDKDALKRFMAGELGAVAVTQKEVMRLVRLSEQGKGPDWHLEAGGSPYTDQVLYLGIHASGDEREELSCAFLNVLLSDENQALLSRWGFFSATNGPSGYSAGDFLAAIDMALRRDGLHVPMAFGGNPERLESSMPE